MDNEYIYMVRDNATGEHLGGRVDYTYFDYHSGKPYVKKPAWGNIRRKIMGSKTAEHVVIVKYKLVEVEQIKDPGK